MALAPKGAGRAVRELDKGSAVREVSLCTSSLEQVHGGLGLGRPDLTKNHASAGLPWETPGAGGG